jgi:hypothetical protein
LFFLRVLGAFALMGAITLFSIVIVATCRAERPSDIAAFAGITRAGGPAPDRRHADDDRVRCLARDRGRPVPRLGRMGDRRIVLWAIGTETGRRSTDAYGKIGAEAARLAQSGDSPRPELRAQVRSGQAVGRQLASTAAVLIILADMIRKPGA